MILVDRAPCAGVVPLDEMLDLHAARPLAEMLLARRGSDLELDASSVRRLGGLCLQVLLSAADAWAEDGRSLALLNPSAAFTEGLACLGVVPSAS